MLLNYSLDNYFLRSGKLTPLSIYLSVLIDLDIYLWNVLINIYLIKSYFKNLQIELFTYDDDD